MEKWATYYPKLSATATFLFGLPASSYFSERIFSVTGRIFEQCRQNLDDKLVDDIYHVR